MQIVKKVLEDFLQLITTSDRYKPVIDSSDKVEEMFKGMSPYAENPNYVNLLSNVYQDRIKPIIETENMLVPKKKPLFNKWITYNKKKGSRIDSPFTGNNKASRVFTLGAFFFGQPNS